MRSGIGITSFALALYLGLFVIIGVGWTRISASDAPAPEVLEAVDELAEAQDCSHVAEMTRRLCEFRVENLRESHAQSLGGIQEQIDQQSDYIGALTLYLFDTNGNGRITCQEARSHGIAPVTNAHPAYIFMRDGDGDGVVCES